MALVDRRTFLRATLGVAAAGPMLAAAAANAGQTPSKSDAPTPEHRPQGGILPAIFVGHGSPMNAIEDNAWSRGFRALAAFAPRPTAILTISAHWYVSGIFTSGNQRPKTIHDFGGFPQALYDVQYPAPGDPALAERVAKLIGGQASIRDDWGLDHGTWSVLRQMMPAADIPVVQLSLDLRLTPAAHLDIGRRLAPLRHEGVLLLGSGNLTHNLRHAFASMQRGETVTPDWARAFDADAAQALAQHDLAFLTRALDSDAGRLSHPTPDHWLPVLYAAAAVEGKGPVQFPITGFDLASLSMRSAVFG